MKITLLIFLTLCFNLVNAQDSIRVTLCTYNYDGCQMSYGQGIEHFDSLGRTYEVEHYYKNGCNHPADSIMRLVSTDLYTFDINGNVIVSEARFASSSSIVLKSYDSFGRIVATQSGYIVSGNTQFTGRDSTSFDSNGNEIWFLAEIYNGTSWDTSKYYTWQFDLNNRLIYESRYEPFNSEEYIYQHDTLPYQITTYRSYSINGLQIDSTRIFKIYYPDNRLEEYWNSQWDNSLQAWSFTDRTRYEYDTIANINYSYMFDCPDTLCQDSVGKNVLTYDSAGRLIDASYYDYGSLVEHFYAHYSGNLILDDGYHAVDQGCDDWEYNYYTYNSNLDLIHTQSIQIHCNGDTITCGYNILTGDSMLLASQGTSNACPSDTIYPVIALAGGHSPFILQWTPANGILDPDSLMPRIVADSSITYQLSVTDSLGTTQIVSVPVSVYQSNFHLANDTVVCQNGPLTLSAGASYSSYQWSTGSTSGVISINTSVVDTQTIWLTVQDMQCFFTDTENVMIDVCAGIRNITDDLISIYPNPSNGNVTFNLDQILDEITLIDHSGRIIQQLNSSKKTFSLNLKPGIYFARLKINDRIMYRRIIVY